MSEVRARVMKDGEYWVRGNVVADLDSRTSDLDLQTLLSALHDPERSTRESAVKRVEELNEIRAISHLIKMLPTRDSIGEEYEEVLLAIFSALAH